MELGVQVYGLRRSVWDFRTEALGFRVAHMQTPSLRRVQGLQRGVMNDSGRFDRSTEGVQGLHDRQDWQTNDCKHVP